MNICIGKLRYSDYFNNFLGLLEQLTEVNADQITYERFCRHLDSINSDIFVMKDAKGAIVGTGSIFIEKKFIHNLSSVGHIEDIVVDEKHRGKGFGKKIIDYLVEYGKNQGCYKIILDCSGDNVFFYNKCGFTKKDNHMVMYF